MKLAAIEKIDMITAAEEMERKGVDSWSEYWVRFENGKEFQFKHLVRKAYEIATGEKVKTDFFQSNECYRSFIERKFNYSIIFKVPDNISFFKKEEIEYFAKYAGTTYSIGNEILEDAGKRIKEEIFKKTNVWIRLLNLDDWKIELDNKWQISGKFKKYSFVRVYKQKDKNSKIFFSFGVDSESKSLVYKLDCQHSQYNPKHALLPEQVSAIKNLISGTSAEWNQINQNDLISLDWEKLRQVTIDFIGRYEFLYEEAIELVKEISTENSKELSDSLPEFPVPKIAFDKLPEKKYSFKGVVVDYDVENKNSKKIGDCGEELVIKNEKLFLAENGLSDLVNQVKKVKDGEGYDILSFNLDRTKKYIEVKTTTGNSIRPFVMTDNEWEFMRQYSDQYHLYRIYDLNTETKQGKLFRLSGNLENKVYVRQKQVEVFLKSQ